MTNPEPHTTGDGNFEDVDAYVAGLEDASGIIDALATRYTLPCYIDDCGRSATYVVHSYPDTVRLCDRHKSLHPVEPHETLCSGAFCAVCERV